MTDNEAQSSDNLVLSWPKSVTYDIDHTRLDAGSTGGGREATAAETRESTAATTYNGIPLDVLGDAQKLFGDEIRVLDLKKGTPGDPLLGSLRKVRLSDSIVYEPLSYTWNDYDTLEASEDDNEDDILPTLFLSETQYYINLGSNCAKALSSVRKSATERTIWVDSICVNQEDQEERSRQVDMMKRIYARSFTVLVYLGRSA
ncbi:hypothetical protein Daus18300_008111 [Diaporthe australafricana]|uniref:Heterokaryon incompatibility domain-containing protein n=1 Tax=Diaporthe australafricana TaxID=127596 RepID=A0ABR3WJI8_9PEZI